MWLMLMRHTQRRLHHQRGHVRSSPSIGQHAIPERADPIVYIQRYMNTPLFYSGLDALVILFYILQYISFHRLRPSGYQGNLGQLGG